MNLASVDLNLLVVFRALMAECHVTRAGAKLGLSQSGMSNALARLRDLAGDKLFVRTGSGMVPTQRARDLGPRVQQALALIEGALDEEHFDAASHRRTYVVAMPDAIEGLLVGPLSHRMSTLAPNARLAVVPLRTTRPALHQLRSDADLLVGAIEGGQWRHEALYVEGFRLLFDAEASPPERMTLARYCQRQHVVWSSQGDLRGHVDDLLAEVGRTRDVVVSTGSFLAIPHLLRGTSRLATLPSRIATMLATEHGLVTARVPVAVSEFEIRMAWHPVWDDDAGSSWLRQQVREVAATL